MPSLREHPDRHFEIPETRLGWRSRDDINPADLGRFSAAPLAREPGGAGGEMAHVRCQAVWVGGVEIPSEVVDAHRSGRLVLFIGAGASRDSPSDLPDFRRLTKAIADDAHFPVNDGDLLHPDVVLGRIEDRGVDVHLRVAEHLGDPHSKYNQLHKALADLALSSSRLRIVTTNFDRHLSSAIAPRAIEGEEYAAPALPVGNDFTGLVYLHGTLSQPPARLVVTDGDFGRAYLRDAWAARFLERMFAEFSVLFIGYSHGDVVMRYLARALGPDGHRYVLTDTPKAPDWKDLGLRPIGYEVVDGSHAALCGALTRWAEIAGMGLLDHRQRVADLVASPPSEIPEDASYVEDLITDPDRVVLFTEFARAPEWLDWASTQTVFKDLLIRGSKPSKTGRALAGWFVEFFVMEEEHTARALSRVTESSGYLGPEICHEIGSHLHGRAAPRPDWLGLWLVLLLRDAPTEAGPWIDYALQASTWPADREQILLLFDHLTEPTAGLTPAFGLGPPHLDIHVRGDDHWLRKAWAEVLKPNLSEVAHAVVAMADRHLRRAHDLQVAASPGNSSWDAVSFGRHAIEPHPQDRYAEPIDVLIDAARDGLEALLDASHPIAVGYLRSWAEADSQILRRLAIHGWTHTTDCDSSAKLDWVVRSGWLLDHRVRHEIFRLVADALPAASDETVEALISAAFERDEEESEHLPYERFNALVWMDRARPDHPRITAALAEAHAVDSNWQARTDPDLTHSIEVGFVPSRPPMSVESFHEQVEANPSRVLSTLRHFKGVSSWEGGPTWEDSLALVTSAIQTEPSDGYRLLDVEPQDPEVTRAVINGWSRAALDGEAAPEVLRRIAALDHTALARDLARMLADGGRSEGYPTDWTAVPGARQLAQELWRLIPDEEVVFGGTDWLTRAINHPGGHLAQFWLQVVQHDWRKDEEAWSGLAEEHRKAFETMLAGTSGESRTQMAEVICASRLHFLFAADQGWTVQNVMPLLDWTDPLRARRAWNSFTGWGRWNDRMLGAGLMEHYLNAARHLDEFDDEHQGRVLGHLAGIALTSDRDPRDWLPGVIVDLSDEERPKFAEKVADVLEELPREAVEHQWSRWMQRYWNDRLASIPTQLSLDEAAAMAGWIPFLTGSFGAGVQLVTRRPGRFREHDDVLRHLEQHIDDSPDACAAIIGHLMRSTEQPWWGGYQLHRLMPRLRAGSDPAQIRVIVEEAMRLGLSNPDGWQ